MNPLALSILAATIAMLAVHIGSWKLVEAWYGAGGSRLGGVLTPLRVVRGEAIYWVLVLLGWPLWRPLALKVSVATFAAIHCAAWMVGEFKRQQIVAGPAKSSSRRKLAQAITVFDWIETFALLAVGWSAVLAL
jgi:hypothetical protein